jgi:hypothetical protein
LPLPATASDESHGRVVPAQLTHAVQEFATSPAGAQRLRRGPSTTDPYPPDRRDQRHQPERQTAAPPRPEPHQHSRPGANPTRPQHRPTDPHPANLADPADPAEAKPKRPASPNHRTGGGRQTFAALDLASCP